MNKVDLLDQLKRFTLDATADLLLPTSVQREGEQDALRAAEVYLMRLPDSGAFKKKAPYILHQLLTGKDVQAQGQLPTASAEVRTIFCVYCPDEQEGGLLLLNLMERMRIALLRDASLSGRYVLDRAAGLETVIYPDDEAPYYAGEMFGVWRLPAIEREVIL